VVGRAEGVEAAEGRAEVAVVCDGGRVCLAGLGLRSVPAAVARVRGLRELDLSGNRLAEVPDWLGGLAGLRVLDLSGNQLSELPGSIGGLSGIEVLLLRGNRLVGLPASVAGLGRLVRLDLADNELVQIPRGLGRLGRLARIDLSGNRHLIFPPPEVVSRGGESVLACLRGPDSEGGRSWTASAGPSAAGGPEPAGSAPQPAPQPARRPSPLRSPAAARTVLFLGGAAAVIAIVAVAAGGVPAAGPRSSGAAAVPAASAPPSALRSESGPGPWPTATASAVPSVVPSVVPSAAASSAAPDPVRAARTVPPVLVRPPAAPRVAPPPPTGPAYPVAPPKEDLALGRPVSVTSHTGNYGGSNITDGNVQTYWEGADGAFPQTVTVDLGTVTTVGRLVFYLPPDSDWNSRVQTVSVRGSAGGGYSTVAGSAGYLFNAATGDFVGIAFSPVHIRYVQLVFTANSGWGAAQLSELRVFS
jgi:F5/8 type C domain/Leucine rich repeat